MTDPDQHRFDPRESPAVDPGDAVRMAGELLGQAVDRPERLSGGFSNTNVRVSAGEAEFVLRVHRQPRAEVETELAVQALCAARGVRVPQLIAADLDGPLRVSLSRFVPGVLLSRKLHAPLRDLEPALRDLGQQLATVHAIELEGPGLLRGSRLERYAPFAGFASALREEVQACLARRAGDRLGPGRRRALEAVLQDRWPADAVCQPSNRLLHADCNPKNLLVGSTSNVTLLDWEFAFCGSPVFDFGNLFRFPEDYPAGAAEAITAGYRAAGGQLPDGWEQTSRLLDLVNLCQFLDSETERPRTFWTALQRIDCALDARSS